MAAKDADVVVMAAAVADFRPAHYTDAKIKKTFGDAGRVPRPTPRPPSSWSATPTSSPAWSSRAARRPARSSSGSPPRPATSRAGVLDHGRDKLARKGCDLLVVNEVGVDKTFGQDDNTVHILRRGSSHVVDAGPASKERRRRRSVGCRPGDPLTLGTLSGSRGRACRRTPVSTASTVSIRCSKGDLSVRTPVHVRVRHRGSPGQDL